MEPQGYYINNKVQMIHHVSTLDQVNTDIPLRINCTGYAKHSSPFVTNGIRLDWYLQIIDEGEMQSECGSLSKCKFILWPPEKNHRYELLKGQNIGYYWAHFTGNYAETLIRENGIEPEKIYSLDEETLKTLRREWGFLFREYMLRRTNYDIMVTSLLMSIIVRLGREIKKNSPEGAEGDLRKRLETSASYIHNHYTEQFSVKLLSEMEHLSESRLRELFRSAFGVSPGEYIINLRIERAGELLLTTDSSVASIAEYCGYSDELYFSRLFKKKTGVSPLSYRREYQPIRNSSKEIK